MRLLWDIMKLNELIGKLKERCPENIAEDWDNPGLLVGHFDREIRRILLTLDVTDDVIETGIQKKADLIISHHPLIFGGVKKVNDRDLTGRRILRLAENGIACYAMHTNFDICKMADLNASQLDLGEPEVLWETGENENGPYGIGKIGFLPDEMTLEACCGFVKSRMKLPYVIVYGDPDRLIRRAAVSSGSGRSAVPYAMEKGADVLVTGDIDHHTALDAVSQGLSIIDAGHYGTEYCFMDDMKTVLSDLAPDCQVETMDVRFPGKVV